MTEVFNNENKGKPRFTFVVATQMTEDDWRSGRREIPIMQSLAKMTLSNVDVRVYVFFDNHDGLPTCYNKALNNIKDSDFLCFVHDDWFLCDPFFFDTIISSKFDLIGAVGGLVYAPPSNWRSRPFMWSHACQGKASGFVMHKLPNGQYYPSSFGIVPSPTVTLDGQCLIMNRNAIDKGLRLDEQFKFDHYDLDLCFQARKIGLSVGTAPIMCIHESMGQGMMQHVEKYMDSQIKFIEKWENHGN